MSYITHNEFDVIEILGYNKELDILYYEGSVSMKPEEKHIYAIESVKLVNRINYCVTCNLTNECSYYNALLSPSTEYIILECLGPSIPYVKLYKTKDIYSKGSFYMKF